MSSAVRLQPPHLVPPGPSAADDTDIHAILALHSAVRRVATVAAGAASGDELFDAVNRELARLVGADAALLLRFEADDTITRLAAWTASDAAIAVGDQQPVNATLRRLRDSARPTRCRPADALLTGALVGDLWERRMRATVAVPIQVDGRVWGVSVAAARSIGAFPGSTETRMVEFAELVAAAISNAQGHAELAASRARVIGAADECRRQIKRDLHDGAQQRLVHTVVRLKLATAMLERTGDPAIEIVGDALASAQHAEADLRELVSGVMPSALRSGGLHGAVDVLLRHIDLPVSVEITSDRLSTSVETTAYFVIAEALTNAVKHASATRVDVRAAVRDAALEIEVRDDGIGGADMRRGTGLVGLVDRVESVGGRIAVTSPSGAGTTLALSLPDA
jgi:signal transduction histidine kinase